MNAKEFINLIHKENDRLGRSYRLLMLQLGVREYLFEEKMYRNIPEVFFELAISELLQRDITYNTGIHFPVRHEGMEEQKKINNNELFIAFHKAEIIIKNSKITIL